MSDDLIIGNINVFIPEKAVKDYRSTIVGGSRLCDVFYDCLLEGRKLTEKYNFEKDYILFIHATSKGGLAHSVDELYDDGFKADGVVYGFHFPFSPVSERVVEKIQAGIIKRKKGLG